jgi:hypothetical protein
MEIRFDEEKVKREGKYDLEKMHEHLDDYFLGKGFTKMERGVYRTDDRDKNKDYTRCGIAMNTLDEIDWFMDNVSMWNWHMPHAFDSNTMVYDDIPRSLSKCGYNFPAYAHQKSLIKYA